MARVTVEDCAQVVSNRFELVVIAAQRAKDISAGNPITLDRDNDKNVVVALREIAAESVSLDKIKDTVVEKYCRYSPQEEDKLVEESDNNIIESKEISSLMSEESEIEGEEKILQAPIEEELSDSNGDKPNFSDDNIEVDD